jgi:hypothetical protein
VVNTSSPQVPTNEDSKKLAYSARLSAIATNALTTCPILLYNAILDPFLPLHEDGPDINRLVLSMKHPTINDTIFKSVSRNDENPNLLQFTTLKDPSYESLANEIVARLGMVAEKQCGHTAWNAFCSDYKKIQQATYKFDEVKGIYLSKMDKIQSQLPPSVLKIPKQEESDDDSLSSIKELDKNFCVIQHLTYEMLNSFRV